MQEGLTSLNVTVSLVFYDIDFSEAAAGGFSDPLHEYSIEVNRGSPIRINPAPSLRREKQHLVFYLESYEREADLVAEIEPIVGVDDEHYVTISGPPMYSCKFRHLSDPKAKIKSTPAVVSTSTGTVRCKDLDQLFHLKKTPTSTSAS